MSTTLDGTWTGLESFPHPVTAAVVGASRGIGFAIVDSVLRDRTVARVGSIEDNRLSGWYRCRASKAAQNMVTRNLSIELRRTARGIVCVALHPGTVDTALCRPFQGNVPEGKLFSPARAAEQLPGVIDRLGPRDNGHFIAWDGQLIPW